MINSSDKNSSDAQQVVLADPEKIGLCSDVLSENYASTLAKRNFVPPTSQFEKENLVLYCVEEITFEEESPRLEALENVLSCMSVEGVNLIYLILGDKQSGGVKFYFGFAKDTVATNEASDSIRELGRAFIKPAIEGNFRGSSIRELKGQEIEKIQCVIAEKTRRNCETLFGVPGGIKDKEKQDFRGIDRLVDVMQGDEFGFMIIAKPINESQLLGLRKDVFTTYELLSSAAKHSIQLGFNQGTNKNISVNTGLSITSGNSLTVTTNRNETKTKSVTENHSDGDGGSSGTSTASSVSGGKSIAKGQNTGKTKNFGETEGAGSQQGISITTSYDLTDKSAADWVEYLDEVLIPRLDYARGKGAFTVNTVLFGETPQTVRKLSNVARSIFSGETANMLPLSSNPPQKNFPEHFATFSLPFSIIDRDIENHLPYIRSALLGYSENIKWVNSEKNVLYSGNWMSVRELALMAGLPQKEVIGMRLKEEVEFGLNVPKSNADDNGGTVVLGNLVKSGIECREVMVELEKNQLDRHVFIAGVTGSGKTTTCQTLLLSCEWPFLVIEPAKTEYRGLKSSSCKDLLVFTLGDDTVAPFRLNPFEFIPGENITSRVDMLMASISASFDMEAAIPQLIERSIYACYQDYGWDLATNQNKYFKNYSPKDKNNYAGTAFEDGVFSFPTLTDVLKKTEIVVNEQGFDDRLKRDYIGSIKARLQGLTLGAKGFMLDCQRSIDFLTLLDKKVVLEIEAIPNAAQKSLIIGFVLTNLLQAIKKKFHDGNGNKIKHITLIEEAHRLLTKPEPGSSSSQKQATETFTDMLAEIRKYGESLIIADQIPGKLTPEVIKNTNTKIIHRLFAQDDKKAVGNTMGLEDSQAKFLSNLPPGRAILFNGNWPKAIQLQITQKYKTDSKIAFDEAERLREAVSGYYAENYKRGVFAYSDFFNRKPLREELEELIGILPNIKEEFLSLSNCKYQRNQFKHLIMLINKIGVDNAVEHFFKRAYFRKNEKLCLLYRQIFQALISSDEEFGRCGNIRQNLYCSGNSDKKEFWK